MGVEIQLSDVLKLILQYKTIKNKGHNHKPKEIQNPQELCSLVLESNLPLLKDYEEIINSGFLICISIA